MYVDSHCHLDFPELQENLPTILEDMKRNQVNHALCVSVTLPEWPRIVGLIENHANLWGSVGVHPDYQDTHEADVDTLCRHAEHPKIVAIGETGLDYYRLEEPLDWQRERFRVHIRAGKQSGLPIIIHTRSSAEDTLRLMREENASACGGVMHCFTESWDVAQQAMDQDFYISISGIVTFKNAVQVQEVARQIPLDRLLIETDSPYLAPVPYRGKRNDPSKVIHVAEKIAELRQISVNEVAEASTNNFFNLFKKIQ